MSVEIMTAVWLNGPTQRSERLLLLAIADNADECTGIAWPSTKTLAAKACMTTRNVSRALESLRSAGWLEILPRTHERGGHTYKVNLVKLNYPGPRASRDKLSAHRKPSADKLSSGEPSSADTMSAHDAEVHQTFSSVHQTLTTVDQTFSTSPPDILNTPLIRTTKNHQNRQEPSTEFVLPDWIPVEPWQHFIEARVSMRKKPTEHAAKLLVDKLDKLRMSGQDPGDVLDQSTANGWMGLFELKQEGKNTNGNLPYGKADGNLAVLAASLERGKRKNRTSADGLLPPGGDGRDDA